MSLRLFAAVSIPDDVAERLLGLMRGVAGAKWRPRENLHLTLRFFGDVTEPVAEDLDAELESATRSIEPFALRLKGAGSFGGVEPHALWVGAVESDSLKQLAAACEKAARRVKMKPEPLKFSPHVTIAYLGGTTLDRVQAFAAEHALFETPEFTIAGFGLYSSVTRKSAPSLYRLEAEYPLLG